ncbi:MAG: helix-turn-helix domain-containing protein [Bacteroidetes bacterium]|nr:helix-turn-helix domain-containing protein [Bacteroidota bacterium]
MKYLENIKATRKAKGLTQQEMSDKIGMAKNNYGKVENGQIELTINRLYQIADILGVSVVSLLGESTGDASTLEELKRDYKKLESENRDLKGELGRAKETIDLILLFKKEISDLVKMVNPETLKDRGREAIMEEFKQKGIGNDGSLPSDFKLD